MRLELSTLSNAPSVGTTGTLMSQWRVGAIVEAVAVRSGDDGQLWLTIGSMRVPARIASGDPAGPTNGERLQLRVLRDSPVIALETLITNDAETAKIEDGLRQFLPRQTSSAPLFSNLAWLADPANGPTLLDKQVVAAAQRLWNALPGAADLESPDGLSKAVKNSGAFLESHLAAGNASDLQQIAMNDVKALLSSLKQVLMRSGATPARADAVNAGPLPSLRGALTPLDRAAASLEVAASPQTAINDLAAQTDGALARMNTTQLVNAEAAPLAAWVVELPYRRNGEAETLRFRFERNGRGDQNSESTWTVEAAMDLGVGGALHARISLHGKKIGVQLRTDSATLQSELQTHSNELVDVLQEAGLQVDRVQCLQGMPDDQPAIRSTPLLAKPLLDIRV